MAVPLPGRVLAAFRRLLVADADLQAYVGVDGDPADASAARVYLKWPIDTQVAHYPAITLWAPRVRLDVTLPRTWNPGFVQVCYYSLERDQRECLEMYEVASRLLHAKKGLLSIAGSVCVHEVVERDARDPVFVAAKSTWEMETLYRVRASIID